MTVERVGAPLEPWVIASIDPQMPAPPVPPTRDKKAQLGDPEPHRTSGAADHMAQKTERAGAEGRGRARPSDAPVVGEDLDDLRFRPYNHPTRDTPQRIRTSKRAVTHDNRRATPNPEPSPYLTTGRGRTSRRVDRPRDGRERRDPRLAARGRGQPRLASSAIAQTSRAGVARRGKNSVGLDGEPGTERLRSQDHGAPSMRTRRPEVPRDVAATQAPNQREAPADNRNRELASNKKLPDAMDMARASGSGDDRGGGRGSAGEGRRGDPTGKRGQPIWLNTPDRRYLTYFRKIYRKIQPLWRFPRDLEILMEQGDVLVQFTVGSDGRLTRIHVRKSSGFPRFDKNAVAAIRRAAPFGPIPSLLGKELTILAPFEFSNPMVR